ncbi:site-specific integrase [Salmonella enterica]|nr:site-specific integrase [Salmonella enterica]
MSRVALRQIAPVVQTTVFDAYTGGLAPSGRRGITSLLNRSANILKRGADADNYPWEQLNYAAVAKVRATLLDDGYAVSSVNMALSALRGVAQTAFNLNCMGAETLARIRSVKRVSGDIQRNGKVDSQPLTTTGLTGILEQLQHTSGIARFTPHDMRRTFITRLLEQGVDINTVRQLAGHSDISTTTRYDCRGETMKVNASKRLKCW